jgi:hypothetical protein
VPVLVVPGALSAEESRGLALSLIASGGEAST